MLCLQQKRSLLSTFFVWIVAPPLVSFMGKRIHSNYFAHKTPLTHQSLPMDNNSFQSYTHSISLNLITYANPSTTLIPPTPQSVYTNSGFSRSVRSNHSWFSNFTYSGSARSRAFLAFCRLQYQ